MSRIEEALEKAAKMRSSSAPYTMPVAPDHIPPLASVDQVTVSNKFLIAANEPNTPAAEEYRKLKSNVVRLTKGDQFSNMLMVTSSVGGEGKSVTALNLAICLAQEYDHTVLLVDADARKPSLMGYLGLEHKVGLTECLLDGLDVSDALVKTGIGRLSVLPAGRQINNPTEVFSSQRTRDFFVGIRNRYHDRYIIIDTPPSLPFAETRSICTFVDGVVFVVKEGAVSINNITEAIECLKGPPLLGIVYNQASAEKRDEVYQYYRAGYPGISVASA